MKRISAMTIGIASLIPLVAGCGLQHTVSASASRHHAIHRLHIQEPAPGHITKMGPVSSRLTVVRKAKVPTWTFETATKTWRSKVPQGPNTIIVAPDYPMGALWSELASAQAQIKIPVTLVAVGWPHGTTLTQASAKMRQILSDYHLHWPVDYVLQSVNVPSPLTILVRGSKDRALTGLLPSSQDWVSLLNSNSL